VNTQILKNRILVLLSEEDGQYDSQIAEKIGIDLQEIQDYFELLESDGFVELSRAYNSIAAFLTSLGRIFLRDPHYFQSSTQTESINILNVIDSQIQNIVQSGNDAIVNVSADHTDMEKIVKIIDQMAKLVHSSEIENTLKQDYELEAIGLKNELKKSRLNLNRIREMIAVLGDIEGTLGLATRLAPYLIAASPYIERIINQLK